MNDLNSDQLRELLIGNTLKMNALTAENDTIAATLKQRGLQAIDKVSSEHVFVADKFIVKDSLGDEIANSDWPSLLVKPGRRKEIPLTADELKAGGWWCADVSAACQRALSELGLQHYSENWSLDKNYHICFLRSGFRKTDRVEVVSKDWSLKQIHRIGSDFYWSKP